jgi:hypothetical protein
MSQRANQFSHERFLCKPFLFGMAMRTDRSILLDFIPAVGAIEGHPVLIKYKTPTLRI